MWLQLSACVQPHNLSTHAHTYSGEGPNAIGVEPSLISDRAAIVRHKLQLSGAVQEDEAKLLDGGRDDQFTLA